MEVVEAKLLYLWILHDVTNNNWSHINCFIILEFNLFWKLYLYRLTEGSVVVEVKLLACSAIGIFILLSLRLSPTVLDNLQQLPSKAKQS